MMLIQRSTKILSRDPGIDAMTLSLQEFNTLISARRRGEHRHEYGGSDRSEYCAQARRKGGAGEEGAAKPAVSTPQLAVGEKPCIPSSLKGGRPSVQPHPFFGGEGSRP